MHEYFHTKFGFCLWDVGALVVLALIAVMLIVHVVRQKHRERDFEDELSAKMANVQTDAKTEDK